MKYEEEIETLVSTVKKKIDEMSNEDKENGSSIRDKFEERVEYVACETRDMDTEPNKLLMWNAPNGDLYMSICPESHRMGISMRFERSGGCSTKNPRLLTALMDAYNAIAGNFEGENNKTETMRREIDL